MKYKNSFTNISINLTAHNTIHGKYDHPLLASRLFNTEKQSVISAKKKQLPFH